MAQIYVGFHDQRSSSRVLKPPGGGTSDIFGTESPKLKVDEVKSKHDTPTKDNVKTENQNGPDQNADSNSSPDDSVQGDETNGEESKFENLSINEENDKKTGEQPAGHKSETISSIIRQEDNKVKSPVSDPGEKKTPQRIPPGGYSSGLW